MDPSSPRLARAAPGGYRSSVQDPPGRIVRLAAAAGLVALALLAAAWVGRGDPVPPPPGDVRLSLLAVGDTGTYSPLPFPFDGQERVADAMEAEHLRHPLDALVLLGDNFYPDGLSADALLERVGDDLVSPYCLFLRLDGPRAGELAHRCGVPAGERRPIPVHAVLGNHDENIPGSPELQREAIPEFVSNWRMVPGIAGSYELGGGVSLVLLEYLRLIAVPEEEAVAALAAALRSAQGPWRILAVHHPFATLPPGVDRGDAETDYSRLLREAMERAGAPVHAVLAGHEHNLQVLGMEPPYPPLHVVSGSGGRAEPIDTFAFDRRAARAATGYARLDLVERDGVERLYVSLIAVPGGVVGVFRDPVLVSRWSLGGEGDLREETPAAEASAATP